MNQELIKGLLDALESIAVNIENQTQEIERLNDNLESVIGTFNNRSFLNVVASVHDN